MGLTGQRLLWAATALGLRLFVRGSAPETDSNPIGQTNLVSLVRDVIERGSCGDAADCGCAPVVRLHEVGRSLQTGWQPILWIL